MKKTWMTIVTIAIIVSLSACLRGGTEMTKISMSEEEQGDLKQKIFVSENIGLKFPQSSLKKEYNGYTYELATITEEKQGSDGKTYDDYKRTVIYRYQGAQEKQEWYSIIGGSTILGLMDNGYFICLYHGGGYDEDEKLQMLNLETLIREDLYEDKIGGMFQYNQYIMLMCGNEIIRYDLEEKTSKSIINAKSMGNTPLDSDNVFGCNNKIWMVIEMNNGEYKIFSSDLDGNQLAYSGISISDFWGISSVSETNRTLTYRVKTDETDENGYFINKKETVSLTESVK